MTARIDRYSYRVTWSDEDDAYAGQCLEFPYMSWMDESRAGALSGIRTVISDCIQDMEANGERTPKPINPG
ncbi:MAG: hypothetical protein AAGM36_18585 [Cyanobacteria bacterium J06597_1]